MVLAVRTVAIARLEKTLEASHRIAASRTKHGSTLTDLHTVILSYTVIQYTHVGH